VLSRSVHRPLCSRLRPDVRERQTNVRQKHCLLGAGHSKPDDDDDDEVTEKSDTCEQAEVYCTTSRAKKVTGAIACFLHWFRGCKYRL